MPKNSARKSRQSRNTTGVATGRVAKTMRRPTELEGLDVFIGRWLTEGETVGGREGSAMQIVASDVYEWAPGGRFVMHPAYGRIGDVGVGGLEIIGNDPATGQYRTYFFEARETSLPKRCHTAMALGLGKVNTHAALGCSARTAKH